MLKKVNLFPDCPIRNILNRFGDKWSILILYMLKTNGIMRFNELHKAIPDISQKMLTVTLRTLNQDGLVLRQIYPQIPPKVEYSLSDCGKSLLPHIDGLINWAKENSDAIISRRSEFN